MYWKNIMEHIIQLLFILLRYDSREHYFAGSKNAEEVSSSILCTERRCMCIKSTCVVHISALIIVVKCLLYKIAESDPLVSRPTRTSSLQVKGRKGNVVLSPSTSLCLWASLYCTSSLGLLHLQQVVWPLECHTKGATLCHLLKESGDFAAFCQETIWFGCDLAQTAKQWQVREVEVHKTSNYS